MPENDKETPNEKGLDDGEEQSKEKAQASTDAEIDPALIDAKIAHDAELLKQPDPSKETAPAIGATKAGTKNATQKAKKAADSKRRQKTIDDYPGPSEPSDADLKEDQRKADIQDQLVALQDEEDEHHASLDAIKGQKRDLMRELYPHMVESDRHSDAVRCYIKRQKELRAKRATDPVRFAAMLKQAGKAPIDAAFNRQRARGAGRPVRTPMTGAPAKETQE